MKLNDLQIERIKSLETEQGQLTPSAVIEDAKKKSSPLHVLFEWDLARAAEHAWRQRAREIIREVKYFVTIQSTTVEAPNYVRDPDAGVDEGYSSIKALQSNPASARAAVLSELTRAAGNLRRALEISAALGLQKEIDGLLTQVLGVRRVIEQTAA
jgi:hypothetical protein